MSRNIVEEKRLKELKEILEKGWSKETAYIKFRTEWSPKKRSLGQCYVTARALHEILGWEMMHSASEHQFWNRLPDGTEVDFTSDQSGGDGVHKLQGVTGKPKKFKPVRECRSINPRLKMYLDAVREPLSDFKEKYSSSLTVEKCKT